MAVANASWAAGTSLPHIPQIRPTSSSCSSSSSCNLSFRFILGCKSAPKSSLPIHFVKRSGYSHSSPCRCSSSSSGGNNTDSDNDHHTNHNSSSSSSSNCLSSSDWDWSRWTRHFSEIEQAESSASLLQFQLEEAIEKEDFQEASKLKQAIAEAMSRDSISEIMSELKNAIQEERYHDAESLCKNTGSGLVGWWVGYSKDPDYPFGRIVHITPGVGRFVGRSYNSRQLESESPGTPLFEIFVVKETNNTYSMQVAFMQKAKRNNVKSTTLSNTFLAKSSSISEVENASEIDIKVNQDNSGKSDEKSINFEGVTEEEITSVINFLVDEIPELKIKELNLMEVDIEDIMVEDTVKQLMEEGDEQTTSSDESEDETGDLDDPQPDKVSMGAGSDTTEGKNLAKNHFDGLIHNIDNTPSKDEFLRIPAEIEEMERDSFVLHVPFRSHDHGSEESITSEEKESMIAAQGVSELMAPEMSSTLRYSNKIPEAWRNVREMLKLAASQAKQWEKFSEDTNFSRITTSRGDLDPFEGLYIGALGKYGAEVVQLRRKYGNWSATNDSEFFEYVEAVKVTGDMNVPAGQVTFRAKISKGNRSSSRSMYPDELGVVSRYKGQGRIAEFGFKNPKWVEGALLQFNGKGMEPYVKSADLGFLYDVPKQRFLVLFKRLRLPE